MEIFLISVCRFYRNSKNYILVMILFSVCSGFLLSRKYLDKSEFVVVELQLNLNVARAVTMCGLYRKMDSVCVKYLNSSTTVCVCRCVCGLMGLKEAKNDKGRVLYVSQHDVSLFSPPMHGDMLM